jgi:hypothetical protein
MPLAPVRVLTPSRTISIVPGSLFFNGVDSYVDLGAPTVLKNFSQSPFTVIAWFAPPQEFKGGRIVADDSYPYGAGIGGMWALSFGDPGYGRVRFFFRGASQANLDSVSVLQFGKIYMLAGVRDPTAGYRKLYINGQLDNQIASGDTATFSTNTYPVTIGGEASTSAERTYVRGYIISVYLYNRALSDTEIQQIYANPNSPPTSGLVLWLAPDSVDCVNNIWRDKSGNGINGTIYTAQCIPRKATRLLKPVR